MGLGNLGQSGRLTNGKFNVAALQDLNYSRNETARVFTSKLTG